jgi:hypothetical protein
MSSAVMTERLSRGAFATGGAPGAFPGVAAPIVAPTPNVCVVPRCDLKFEKCKGGFKLHCECADQVACATLQNLCQALCDGMCSCSCSWNGVQVCNISLCCGHTKVENTKNGCCITCISGDTKCCEMLQACCDCLECCCKSGCCCYVCFGNTPCCCGTCAA